MRRTVAVTVFAGKGRVFAATGIADSAPHRHTRRMRNLIKTLLTAAAGLGIWMAFSHGFVHAGSGPSFTNGGEMRRPDNYRGWIYLSTGFDMSYAPNAQPGHHMFDNVFVNPEAWQAFQKTGTWPDKTMLVLEVRGAEEKGSINQKGNFQAASVMGLEVHVKDESRFQGKWAFFGFREGNTTAKMIPQTEDCYSCHAQHAAVDTTFVQFYPTLLPVAKQKGTLAASYVKENAH
jgi:hypothetical protein